MLVTQLGPTLCNCMDCSPPDFCPWNSLGKNTGVDTHSLLQRIFPTQGSNRVSCISGRLLTTWTTREAGHCNQLMQAITICKRKKELMYFRFSNIKTSEKQRASHNKGTL